MTHSTGSPEPSASGASSQSLTAVELAELRTVAERLATGGAQLAARLRPSVLTGRHEAGTAGTVETKSSATDPVTVADRQVEHWLRSELHRLRPGEPVLGEEGGLGADGPGRRAGAAGLRWVLDPIDGTVNYLYDFPSFAVSVGVELAGRGVVGAVADGRSGECFSAASGQGAALDGAGIRVSGATETATSLLGTGFAYDPQRRVAQARWITGLIAQIRDIRRGGAASLDLCAVAAGRLDAYAEHGLGRWDFSAGAVIAAEAGAHVMLPSLGHDESRAPHGADLVLAASPGICDELQKLLKEAGAEQV